MIESRNAEPEEHGGDDRQEPTMIDRTAGPLDLASVVGVPGAKEMADVNTLGAVFEKPCEALAMEAIAIAGDAATGLGIGHLAKAIVEWPDFQAGRLREPEVRDYGPECGA